MPQTATVGSVDLDDVTIAYDDTAAIHAGADTPPLVFVHGLAASRHIWDDVSPAFGDRRVVRFDLRGHGDSTGPAGTDSYRIAAAANDLLGVLDALDLAGADVVAHSLGGATTMWAALQRPDAFGRLVLIGTWALGCPPDAATRLRTEARAYARHGIRAIYDGTQAVREADPALGARYRDDAAFAAARRAEMLQMRPEAWTGFVAEIVDDRSFAPWTRDLRPPATLICGGHDDFLPAMRDLATTIGGPGRHPALCVLDDSGHNPMNDDPDAVVALVRNALRA